MNRYPGASPEPRTREWCPGSLRLDRMAGAQGCRRRSAAGPVSFAPGQVSARSNTGFAKGARLHRHWHSTEAASFLFTKASEPRYPDYRNTRLSLIALRALLLDAASAVPLFSALCLGCYCPGLSSLVFTACYFGLAQEPTPSSTTPTVSARRPRPQQPSPSTFAGEGSVQRAA